MAARFVRALTKPHILAIAQAIAEVRRQQGTTGPCYVGKDTHALSEPAFISVLEVLTANGVDVVGRKITALRQPLPCHTLSCASTAKGARRQTAS